MRISQWKLQILMARAGIRTLLELSERSGVHHTTIRRILKGRGFQSQVFARLVEALNCNPLDLLDGEYPEPLDFSQLMVHESET